MLDIKLLDCTLRDGGYVNDWRFGHANMVSIAEELAAAGIDVVELGFLDERRPFDTDRSITPDTQGMEALFGRAKQKGTAAVAMIDYGTCPLWAICPARDSILDGIRVIFKKHLATPALDFCAALKARGYKVFAQLVSITDYSERELTELAARANAVAPYAVSIVDTYGLLHQAELLRYFDLLHHTLAPAVSLGFHAHNNLQMAYANCIAVIDRATALSSPRALLLDGSLCGMGKSAGNAPIELLALYLNRHANKHYRIGHLLEAIDRGVAPFYQAPSWGYSSLYFLAAAHKCHPNYVAYLMHQNSLPISAIWALLDHLEPSKRLAFDKAYIEELYQRYHDEVTYEALPL